MNKNDIRELLELDSSKNGQTLELGFMSPEEWASWLTLLGYRWQVQTSSPWGSDLHTDIDSLLNAKVNEVRIVHPDKIATFRERVGGLIRIEYQPVDENGKVGHSHSIVRWADSSEEMAEVMARLWRDLGTRAFIRVTER